MPGLCCFNDLWLDKPDYRLWLRKDTTKDRSALCIACKRSFTVASTGEGAVISHNDGARHKKNVASMQKVVAPIDTFFMTRGTSAATSSSSAASSSSSAATSSSSAATSSPAAPTHSISSVGVAQKEKHSGLTTYVTGSAVLKAEVLWTLKCIMSHYSMKSCEGNKQIFKAMFPDSNIAASFSCGETKARYLCTFGLGPYFSSQVLKEVKSANNYVLLFDETLNKELQEKQMDVYVRFWKRDCVATIYLDSKFMGHATADILLEELSPTVTSLGHSKLLQVSMDGPNVNLKLERMLKEDIAKQTPMKMLEIGTCGLHILHNAFKNGCAATRWEIETFLSSAYYLFHDSPARREDYFAIPGAAADTPQPPQKFCKHRWLENAAPAERVINILPNLEAYCEAVRNKKVSQPACKSFTEIQKGLRDPLLRSKLEFFVAVAKEVEPFLSLYQTDRPMLPFLFQDLGSLIKSLMTKIVKADVLDAAVSLKAVMRIDLTDDDNLKEPGRVDIGFCAKRSILTMKSNDKDRHAFRAACRDFIKALILKVLTKAPIKFKLVQNLSWLQPKVICSTTKTTKEKALALNGLEQVLNILYEAGRVEAENCDAVKNQYSKFCDQLLAGDHEEIESFRNFDHKLESCRLDRLLHQHLSTTSDFQLLWTVVQQILLLSHGQASVERGFSINKETSVYNLQQEGLKGRRHILQAIQQAGDILSVPITKELLSHASSAHKKYMMYLDEQKQEEKQKRAAEKRKAEEGVLDELKKKRSRLMADALSLEESANKKAEEAENKRRFLLISESNALRKKSQEKYAAVREVEKLIADTTGASGATGGQ